MADVETGNLRVKVFARSFDLKLYRLSKGLYEGMGYPCVRLTDQSADGYFYTMLKDLDCDIAINVDEDAFVTDPEAVKALVRKVAAEGWANAGFPEKRGDGDSAVTNPFFNILNLKLIRTKFDRAKMVSRLDDIEPYYPFFRWMAEELPILYLPYETHADGISSVARDEEGHMLCMHTWYARFYSMPTWMVRHFQPTYGKQKERIDNIIREAYSLRGLPLPQFGPLDKLTFLGNKIIRWVIKVPQRVSRWPWKIRRAIMRKRAAKA